MKDDFTYMGKKVKVKKTKAGDKATITIDGKKFDAKLHTAGKPEDNFIKLWMCDDSYTMTESPHDMAKQIIEYWHQYS